MSDNNLDFLDKCNLVEELASSTKFRRMLAHPLKYFLAIFYREIIYRNFKKSIEVNTTTFFGEKINLLLPAGTDIYLTKGKSHDSEIRLAKFLIKNLKPLDTFIDIGAHYGYFSLLTSKLVGPDGKVIAFEASPSTFSLLQRNTKNHENLITYQLAVSDEIEEIKFFEFPNLYSEYNSFNIEQFKEEKWFKKYPPTLVKVKTISLDSFVDKKKLNPKIIKIDVEGAEFKVINGFRSYLNNCAPIVAMEFLSKRRGNQEHLKAEELFRKLNYKPHIINRTGSLQTIKNCNSHLENFGLESDNIVFMKKN